MLLRVADTSAALLKLSDNIANQLGKKFLETHLAKCDLSCIFPKNMHDSLDKLRLIIYNMEEREEKPC